MKKLLFVIGLFAIISCKMDHSIGECGMITINGQKIDLLVVDKGEKFYLITFSAIENGKKLFVNQVVPKKIFDEDKTFQLKECEDAQSL